MSDIPPERCARVARGPLPGAGVDVERRDTKAGGAEPRRHRAAHVPETHEADRISGLHGS